MISKKIILSTAAAIFALGGLIAPVFAHNDNNHHDNENVVVVKLADLDNSSSNPAVVIASGSKKWFMYNDTTDVIDNTLGSFVSGPTPAPRGVGSIQFTLGAAPLDRKNIATYQFAGTPLKKITKMGFSAYSHSGVAGPTESPYLNFNVDFTGTSSSFQRRLVYVPSANGAVPQDTWNTYDVINSGNALWTWSGFGSNGNKWPDNNTNQYRTWNAIKLAFPNARILSGPVGGWLGVRVGEPGPANYIGNVDAFIFGTTHKTTTFDFEPTVGPPVTKAECKNGGWQTFNNPTFKNKDKCLDYVERHDRTVKGNNLQYLAGGLTRYAEFEANVADQDGDFFYKDANKAWYKVNVSKVKIVGNDAWFSGRVTKSSNPAWVGLWLFAKARNNPDTIWGSFTNQTTAETGVTNMSDPADGPFSLIHGNIF